ncbi:MAG: ATP-dependent helicase [Thermodesulfobacteriota bacterium]
MELNEQQKKAAEYKGEATNILVTAGAGCGKTRTIIGRVIHLVKSGSVDASRILMLTFTNRAAREMKGRLKAELGPVSENVQAGTFHSFCLRVMTKLPKSFGVSGLTILDTDDQYSLIRRIIKKHLKVHGDDIKNQFPKPGELVGYYSYSRNTCQNVKDYLTSNSDLEDKIINICFAIFDEYKMEKERAGYLDFDDLLEIFATSLREKKKLRETVAGLFDEVLVDEMQDTNPLQFDILKSFSVENVRLFCVGDPAQSIYKFRGAEFKNVYDFGKTFGNSKVLPLSLNYRSYQEILDLSNWLLEKSPFDYLNKLEAYKKKGGYLPSLCDFRDRLEEAKWITDKIKERNLDGTPYKNTMILIRTSFHSNEIQAQLHHNKIPFEFVGGMKLTETAHVKDILSLLRVARNPKDVLAWERFLTLWQRIGSKTAEKAIDAISEKSDSSPGDVLSEYLGAKYKNVVNAYKQVSSSQNTPHLCVSIAVKSLSAVLKDRYDKWDLRYKDLQLLSKIAKNYKTIGDFIDDFTLEPMTSIQMTDPQIEDKVLLITVHRAKGTEAPTCFVVCAGPGTYPHSRSFGDLDSEEEERRILYVAITRAQNELFITRSLEDHRGPYYAFSSNAKGEDYFLSEVPDPLVETQLFDLEPDSFGGLSLLSPEVDSALAETVKQKGNSKGLSAADYVRHAKFGRGQVLKVEGSGGKASVIVSFPSVGKKRIQASYLKPL